MTNYIKELSKLIDAWIKVDEVKAGSNKLSMKQVDKIRKRYAKGNIKQVELATIYGVSDGAIWKIVNNKSYMGNKK